MNDNQGPSVYELAGSVLALFVVLASLTFVVRVAVIG